MSQHDHQDQKLKRLLLNNAIICAHSYQTEWNTLKDEVKRQDVSDFAEEAGYRLCYNERGDCYFLVDSVMNVLTDDEAKQNFEKSVATVYQNDVINLKAMMEFLMLLSDVGASSMVIAPGSDIRLEGIAVRLERKGEVIVNKLAEIEGYNFYRLPKSSATSTPLERIRRLMSVLVERGFFVEKTHGTSYRATGKMAFYWDMIEIESERLSITEDIDDEDTTRPLF